MPSWLAYDMRLKSERFVIEGLLPEAGDVVRLTTLLGRSLRSHRGFAAEIATSVQRPSEPQPTRQGTSS